MKPVDQGKNTAKLAATVCIDVQYVSPTFLCRHQQTTWSTVNRTVINVHLNNERERASNQVRKDTVKTIKTRETDHGEEFRTTSMFFGNQPRDYDAYHVCIITYMSLEFI